MQFSSNTLIENCSIELKYQGCFIDNETLLVFSLLAKA